MKTENYKSCKQAKMIWNSWRATNQLCENYHFCILFLGRCEIVCVCGGGGQSLKINENKKNLFWLIRDNLVRDSNKLLFSWVCLFVCLFFFNLENSNSLSLYTLLLWTVMNILPLLMERAENVFQPNTYHITQTFLFLASYQNQYNFCFYKMVWKGLAHGVTLW